MKIPRRAVSLPFFAITALASFAALAPSAVRAAAVTAGPPEQARAARPSASGNYHFVDKARGDDARGDGSRARPWASVTRALASVESPPAGARPAVILIAQGRYAEPMLVLKPRVNLSGGYTAFGDGGDGGLSRDCWNTPTILDGGGGRRIALGADEARLDGLRFENGFASDAGSAILCDGTSPSISGCVFVGNRVAGNHAQGGAIACLGGAAPYIVHNIFFDNYVEDGNTSAFLADGDVAPRLKSNVFFNNHSRRAGAAIISYGGSTAGHCRGEITGNIVMANPAATRACSSGGIAVRSSAHTTVTGNIVVACESPGSSVYVGDALNHPSLPVKISRNVIAGNLSRALTVAWSFVHLEHNLIAENTGDCSFYADFVTAERNTFWQEDLRLVAHQRDDRSDQNSAYQVLDSKNHQCDDRSRKPRDSLLRGDVMGPGFPSPVKNNYLERIINYPARGIAGFPSPVKNNYLERLNKHGASRFTGNILKNPPTETNGSSTFFWRNLVANAPAPAPGSAIPMPVGGENALFRDDGATGEITGARYDAARFVTVFTLAKPVRAATRDYEYCARPVRIIFGADDGAPDQWRVVKSVAENEVLVWGRLDDLPGRAGRAVVAEKGVFAAHGHGDGAARRGRG
ncbi:MAG: DUF1565 domain-containing protein, partial [Opitutaceae bacterium]|nr:DUF1565 domain-containing protein [Opitutaceae bacterium]